MIKSKIFTYFALSSLTLTVLVLTVYFDDSKLNIMDIGQKNLASVISSSSVSKKILDCQSPYQVKKLQSSMDDLQKKINSIPKETASTTIAFDKNEALFLKAKESELIQKNEFNKLESEYNKIIYETRDTQKISLAKSNLVKASSTLSILRNNRLKLELISSIYKNRLVELKSGPKYREMNAKLADLQNSLNELKKKTKCQSVESNGSSHDADCRDLIDNDMNGYIDCEDSACSKNTVCISLPSESEEQIITHRATIIEKCSDPQFTDKESCENSTITGICLNEAFKTKKSCEDGKSVWKPEVIRSASNTWEVIKYDSYKTRICSDGSEIPESKSCVDKLTPCHTQLCSLQNYNCSITSSTLKCQTTFKNCSKAKMTEAQCQIKLKYEKDILSARGIKVSN